MSFWPVFRRQRSLIDEILEKDEFTLEELLDQDDIVQECRYMNDGLLDYLSQPDIVERLIRYVITKPVEGKEDEGPSKYPYIASELFECGVGTMPNALFEKPELLGLLFSLLEQKPPLEPSSVAYFRKVVSVLIQRKFEELTEYLRDDEKGRKALKNMIHHIGLHSILELLNLLTWDDVERAHTSEEHMDWLCEERLIARLVEKLDPSFESQPEVHANAAQALVDAALRAPIEHRGLQAAFNDKETLTKLFSFLASKSESSLQHCLSVLIAYVQRHIKLHSGNDSDEEHFDSEFKGPGAPGHDQEDETGLKGDKKKSRKSDKKLGKPGEAGDKPSTEKASSPPLAGGKKTPASPGRRGSVSGPPSLPFADLLIEHLPHLLKLLRVDPKSTVTTLGKATPRFGPARLKIVELILWVLRTSDLSLEKKMIELKVLPVLFDMFEQFEWHNMLHIRVWNAVEAILDGQSIPVQKSLFLDAKILDRLMYFSKRNDELFSRPKGTRVGYMGHVIQMSNSLIDWHKELCSQTSAPDHSSLPSSVPHAGPIEAVRELKDIVSKQMESKEWQAFIKEKLSVDNERMQVVLGGHRPGDVGVPTNPGPAVGQQEEYEVRQQQEDEDDDELFNFDDPEIEDSPEAPGDGEGDGEFFNFFGGGGGGGGAQGVSSGPGVGPNIGEAAPVNQHTTQPSQTELDSSSDDSDSDGDEYSFPGGTGGEKPKKKKDTNPSATSPPTTHQETKIAHQETKTGHASGTSSSSTVGHGVSSSSSVLVDDSGEVDDLDLPNIQAIDLDGGPPAGVNGTTA